MDGIAYPVRTDAVRYECFEGTLDSIQRISNLACETAYITINPDNHYCKGDTMRVKAFEIGTNSVAWGHYVVRTDQPEQGEYQIAVLPPEEFRKLYIVAARS